MTSFIRLLLAISLIIGLTQTQFYQAAALTQGDRCSKLDQARKVGKIELRCVGTDRIKYWIQTPTVIPVQKSVSKVLTRWTGEVGEISFEIFVTPLDVESANNDLVKINQAKSITSSKLAASEGMATKYKNDALIFDASAKAASLLNVEKKKIYDAAQTDYVAAQNRTNAYSSQYQAALSSRSSNLACGILKDFGFVGSCSTNYFQDALDVQTIRTYEGLKIASDSARAKFVSAADVLIASTKNESKELDNAKLALDTSELYNLRTADWKSKAEAITVQEEFVKSFLDIIDLGTALQEELSDKAALTISSIEAAKNASKKDFKTKYQKAFNLVAYMRLAREEYEQTLREKISYSSQVINVEESLIWKPSDYFKGSSYSDIQNASGVDFGWSWSKGSNCVQYASCKNVFVTTSKDCIQASITLDFMTDSKVSESKSLSRAFAIKSGEITIVEIESKYTDTAKSAYLRAFNCTPSQ